MMPYTTHSQPKTETLGHAGSKKYQQRLQQDSMPQDQRAQTMDAANPKYILRNWVAQLAIDESNKGNYQLASEIC